MITTLSAKQLRKAANLQDKIAALEKKLAAMLGGSITTATVAKPARKKRRMSAAGRAEEKAQDERRGPGGHPGGPDSPVGEDQSREVVTRPGFVFFRKMPAQ
jgi:hypothetical protein